MENVHIALARHPYDTIESWYHQGVITQVEWEAWHYARVILSDAGPSQVANFPDDAMELGDKIVAQWREDHEGKPAPKPLTIAEETTLREHWDGYPHNPGTLYDCPDCENNCYCDDMGMCLHCELNESE